MGVSNHTPMEVTRNLKSCLERIVDEVNSSSLTIYSYSGNEQNEPIYYEETVLFKEMLEKAGLCCRVIDVYDQNFSPQNWDANSLIYIPGALASNLDKHLGSKIQAIHHFVNTKGGGFIGWCGAGYWACRKTEYQLKDRSIQVKERQLAFWQGTEKGPLFPIEDHLGPETDFSHEVVKIKWLGSKTFQKYVPDGLEFHALLSGGGWFVPAQQEHPYKVLATYQDVAEDKKFAVVKTSVGAGNAILINPYLIYTAEHIRSMLAIYEKKFPRGKWPQMILNLEGTELKCMLCFADMLLEAAGKKVLE